MLTPEEKADQQGVGFENDVATAVKTVANAAVADAEALLWLASAVTTPDSEYTPSDLNAKTKAVADARDVLNSPTPLARRHRPRWTTRRSSSASICATP